MCYQIVHSHILLGLFCEIVYLSLFFFFDSVRSEEQIHHSFVITGLHSWFHCLNQTSMLMNLSVFSPGITCGKIFLISVEETKTE